MSKFDTEPDIAKASQWILFPPRKYAPKLLEARL
jgi:hypothetical protein